MKRGKQEAGIVEERILANEKILRKNRKGTADRRMLPQSARDKLKKLAKQ